MMMWRWVSRMGGYRKGQEALPPMLRGRKNAPWPPNRTKRAEIRQRITPVITFAVAQLDELLENLREDQLLTGQYFLDEEQMADQLNDIAAQAARKIHAIYALFEATPRGSLRFPRTYKFGDVRFRTEDYLVMLQKYRQEPNPYDPTIDPQRDLERTVTTLQNLITQHYVMLKRREKQRKRKGGCYE